LAKHYRCGFLILGRTDLAAEVSWAGNVSDKATLRQLVIERFPLDNPGIRPKPAEIERAVNTALAHQEITATIEAIQGAGGRVSYVPCDVRDSLRLKTIIASSEQELGLITGFVHGAGNIADKKIQRKTVEDYEQVFSTKIDGLAACLNCLPPDRLKYLILFSSVAGYFGNSGQSDYAMANEVLNKFSHYFRRQYPHCQTISLNWGLWDGGSMASEPIRKVFTNIGLSLIPMDIGTQYFCELFSNQPAAHPSQVIINCNDRPIRHPMHNS
jgi:hypothetical protein